MTLAMAAVSACSGGFDRPLTPDEAAPYQLCAAVDECQLVANRPRTCCQLGGLGPDAIAINKNKAADFADAFEQPDCDNLECAAIAYVGPDLDPAFLQNKYTLGCTSGRCTVANHEGAGAICNSGTPCATGYECRDYRVNSVVQGQVCWYDETTD